MKKKLISLLLVLVLLFQISGSALAAIGNYIGNTPAQNQEIFDQLAALTGGTSDEARALLSRLGLLDEKGNLDLTATITMDGKSMTVDEVRKLLAEPGTDLTKIVNVDGIPLTMGDLQTILNIEAELARIQETYFSGKTFGADATDNLNSLMSQIETQGISVHSEPKAAVTPETPARYWEFMDLPENGRISFTAAEGFRGDYKYINMQVLPEKKYNDGLELAYVGTDTIKVEWYSYDGSGEPDWSDWNQIVNGEQRAHESPEGTLKIRIRPTTDGNHRSDENIHGRGYLIVRAYSDPDHRVPLTAENLDRVVIPIDREMANPFSWNNVLEATGGANAGYGYQDPNLRLCDLAGDTVVIPLLPYEGSEQQKDLYTYLDRINLFKREITLSSTSYFGLVNHAVKKNGDTYPYGILYPGGPGYQGGNVTLTPKVIGQPGAQNEVIIDESTVHGGLTQTVGSTITTTFTNPRLVGNVHPLEPFKIAGMTLLDRTAEAIPIVGNDCPIPSPDLLPPNIQDGFTKITVNVPRQTVDEEYWSLALWFDPQDLPLRAESAPKRGEETKKSGPFKYEEIKDLHTTTDQNRIRAYAGRWKLTSFKEESIPTIGTITAPAGNYISGQIIPVIVQFSEPVSCCSVKINDQVHECADRVGNGTGCYSEEHIFEYTVKPVDNTTLTVRVDATMSDPFGHKVHTSQAKNVTLPGITLVSAFLKNAVDGATAEKTSLTPNEAAVGTALKLTLNDAEAYQTKYANYPDDEGSMEQKAPFVAQLRGTENLIPFTLTETDGKITGATAPTGALAFNTAYTYDILAYEYNNTTGKWSTTPVPTKKSVTVTVGAMVFADMKEVTYPEGDKTELSLTDPYVPTLGVKFKNTPTFTSGTWASSNPDIATIDAAGKVKLEGKAVGKVAFTFAADDGKLGLTDPYPEGKTKSVTSKEYTVTAGAEAAIVVPKGGDTIIALQNAAAQVQWYGNMAQSLEPKGSKHVKYTVEVFEGNLTTEAAFVGKVAVHTATDLAMEKNSYEIPVENLKNLSTDTNPAYTVRISAPHPVKAVADSGIELYAYAYIIVNPVPVTVKLTPPEKRYVLDTTGTSSVNWNITNYNPDATAGTEATLTVERVTEAGVTTKIVADKPIAVSGTESFPLTPVTGDRALRDLYVVTVKAKNKSDTVWNSDSYQFYVYKNGALDIVVGETKEKKNDVTLSNRGNALVTAPPTVTKEIMELRSLLGLNTTLGINYGDYAWSALKDGIKWESSDKTKVGLNFKQGSFYENVDRFHYDSYLPATTMAISGTGETKKTVITATHANTGMSTTLDVKVESLQNKLYLFQMTPMIKTTLTYTDGAGAKKSVDTNSEGTLALYEPNGIKGAAYFRAVDISDLYLGTIFAGSLRSGEGNTLVRDLYPINILNLRRVARTDLFLKNPDGTPYEGSVTVRGGVYKDGGYCQDAQFGVNNMPLQPGTTPKTVTTGEDGRLTIQMDSSQFWSAEKGESAETELYAGDKLEYIFELSEMSGKYPALMYVNGVSPVLLGTRTGEGVFTLEATEKHGVFLTHQQTVDKNGDRHNVRNRPAYAGPNETTPKGTDLESTLLLWGEAIDCTDYTVQLLDEFGFRPSAQKSVAFTYPFSSIPAVRHTMTLTKETLTDSGWVPEGQPRGVKLQVLKSGTLQKEIPTDIKAADLSNVPKLQGETAKNIMVDLTKGSGVGIPEEMDNKNAVIKGLMKRLSGGSGEGISGPVNGSNFKMIISPGDDSATFKAFIWAGHNSLGLEDAVYDKEGLSVTPHLLEDDLSTGFGSEDAVALATGGKEAAKTGADLAKTGKSVSGGGSFGGQLEGYYECLIQFNFKTQKWEIFTLGGGFTVGFGGSFGKSINQMVGLIPITASFELGAAIQLDFKMASRYKVMGEYLEWSDEYKDKKYVSDFLTTLRINAYFEAFGGIGFDISIVALKFGVFGRLGVDNSNAFLSRPYLKQTLLRQVNGQALKLTGEVGIKFVLTVIGIIDYEATLASIDVGWTKYFNNWEYIQDYWKNTGSGLGRSVGAMAAFGARNGLTLVDASATLQSRDYLEDFERTWGAPRRMSRALDGTSGLLALQSNAYPNSRPYVTDDGEYLLYTSEQSKTDLTAARIYASVKNLNGTYPEGTKITPPTNFDGFGDSDLRLAGKKNLAVAAWVRQNTDHQLKAGDAVTTNLQSVLTNATEIVASVNTGSGWASTRLTTNGSPDLAPVVAACGDKAIVAWRSVYAADAEKPMDFTAQDKVLYKIYDKTLSTWSDAKTLYPGTSGVVKGMEAAMLPDGTAAVTYVLDRSGTGDAATYEVAATIVKADGEPGRTLMLTNDKYSDENPQIAAVDCGTAPAVDLRFIIGWYSTKGEGGDIRMAALDAEGLPSATFPESLGQIAKETMIGNNFRFVAADKLENLSILWSATSQDQTKKGDQLLGVKFLPKDGKIGLSAPIDVATLPANNNTDHFDAYVSDAAINKIKAVIQGTEYGPMTDDPATYDSYTVDWESPEGAISTQTVKTPKAKTMLYTATETYQNKMTLTQVWADYANLAVKSLLPVQFTVQNSGFEPLKSVSVTLGGETQNFEVNLAPNESTTLTLYHAVGATVADVNYTITPTWESAPGRAAGPGRAVAPTAGTLHLDYPDLGIAGLKVIAEKDGKRDLRITLYNGGAAKLNKENRTINIAFYDNSFFEGTAVDVTYGESSVKKITISDTAQLTLADNGALCADVRFDLDAYLTAKSLKESGEIPATGMRLYAKVWVEDSTKELPEFHEGNNTASAQLDSLLHRAGEPVTITVAQSLTEDGKTKAEITVRNNSLKRVDGSGNVTAALLDKDGKVLETQQSYRPEGRAIVNGLITLEREQSETVSFTFSQAGASVKVTYGALVLDDNTNTELTSLSATGIPIRLADFKADPEDGTKFTATASTAAGKTLITALTKDPRAAVTVNGAPMPQGGAPLTLTAGENKITIVITAQDNTTKRTYELLAERTTADPISGNNTPNTYAITATAGPGGSIAPRGTSRVSRGGNKTYTITPDKGYAISDVLVDGVSAGKVSNYTFEKVRERHTIEAHFAPMELVFKDVAERDWFYSAVQFVAKENLMGGVGDDHFNPLGNSSRATVATVLYRMAGSPAVAGTPGFGDVPTDQWHSNAIAWAAENGVAQGNGKKFAPDDDVTREQLAQLFYNYAKLKKYDMTPAGDLSKFTDAPTGWSRDAMAWAVGCGIITGKGNGVLDPAGEASRVELAAMLMRLQKLEQ